MNNSSAIDRSAIESKLPAHLVCACRVGVHGLVRFSGDIFGRGVERAHRKVDHPVKIPLPATEANNKGMVRWKSSGGMLLSSTLGGGVCILSPDGM